MAVTDVKFSNFADGGDLEVTDIVVGLRNGVNTRFNFNGAPGLYLPLTGGTMAGAIDMDNNVITGLPTPNQPSDAVPKSYVDGLVAGEALTRVDDTNVTLTLGGTPATALLQAVSLTLGWTGTLSPTRGGTGIGTYTLGDTLYSSAANTLAKLAGNTTTTKQYLSQTGDGVNSAAPAWATISGSDITGAALTKTDDTNVTLTLGGTPTTALLRAASLTLGWTGQLALTRGGTNASLTASNGGIVYSTATALAILAGTATAGQILRSGASSAPSWSTATYPATAGTTGNVLKSDGTNWISSADTPGALTQNHILVGNASNVAADVAMSGDATIVASGALTIANSAVTNAKLANMADQTIKGNVSGGSAAPSDLTASQTRIMLGLDNAAHNIVIGGDFGTNPWQRGTSLAFSGSSSGYLADRFVMLFSNDGALTYLKTADAPTVAQAGVYTSSCLHLDVTTADATMAAGQYATLETIIEGYDIAKAGFGQSGTRYITLSFWHKHTKTGTYCVGFQNSGSTRSYIAEYTQSVSDTWEQAVLIIQVDTTGTWLYTNGAGLGIYFTMAAGSTYQVAAGSWQAGNYFASSNQVNAMDNTANNFKIALVMLNFGYVQTPFPLEVEQQVFAKCQRYYEKSYSVDVVPGTAPDYNGSAAGKAAATSAQLSELTGMFKVSKRATPTITIYNPNSGASASMRDETATTNRVVNSVDVIGLNSWNQLTTATNCTAGDRIFAQWTASAEF